MKKLTDTSPVAISDLHMMALRSFIMDGPDAWEGEYTEKLASEAGLGFSLLLHCSLAAAARRIFAPAYSISQVIRYVADVRVALEDDAHQLNPRVTENLLRSALGDEKASEIPPFGVDETAKTHAELLLLVALITDAGLDESGVDELINEAADKAGQFDWSPLVRQEGSGSPHPERGRHGLPGVAEGS